MIEELPNGKVRMTWEFSKHRWEQMEEAAKQLGFSDAEEMITDGSLGHLKRVGINPLQDWI